MKLTYIATSVIPAHKANAKQVMKMCQAFKQLGNEIELVIPVRFGGVRIKANPFEYYNIPERFKITKIFSLDLIPFEKVIGHLGFWVQNISFSLLTGFYLFFKKADFIYSRDHFTLFLLTYLGFSKKLAWEIHSFPKNINWFHQRLFKKINKLVVISHGLKEELVKQGVKEEKILVASDAVDLSEFENNLTKESIRQKFNLPLDKKLIGYVGTLKTLKASKGIDTLIESLKFIEPETLLAIVGGEEEDVNFYKKIAQAESLENRVLFIGQVKSQLVPQYLKAFDVLVMPFPNLPHYALYMSPLKLFEYMASQRPIVTTDLPSIREILDDQSTVFIQPDSSEALAKGIEQVLIDSDLAQSVAGQAYQKVQNYTWSKRANMILNYIK